MSGDIGFNPPVLWAGLMGRSSPIFCAATRWLRPAACLLLAGTWLAPAAVQAQVSATNTARTVLVDNLSVVKSRDMDFGDIVVATGAGTIVMNPTASPTCTVAGGIIRTGACQPAEFVGAGRLNRLVRVRIPASARMTVTNATGATMRIDNMAVISSPDTLLIRENSRTYRLLVLSLSGAFQFRVGGRLNVGAAQAPGIYTGTFDIDVQYF